MAEKHSTDISTVPGPETEGPTHDLDPSSLPTGGCRRQCSPLRPGLCKTIDVFKRLSILDRLLTPAILITMVVGVIIGEYVSTVQDAFNTARFDGVSIPIVIGLIMMANSV
ncbi:Arsenite resistance protein ArsB [Mycena venus]|uniref:Arsenite resistance protein ArsB n=1 Tax=Mycena venus TaxID=2733690 RepID=A0A8H7CWQ4_9AGAR|nr:Arsenite resistance protein ArsB [Mycena venus]